VIKAKGDKYKNNSVGMTYFLSDMMLIATRMLFIRWADENNKIAKTSSFAHLLFSHRKINTTKDIP
jgi:hypothetical protein